MIGQAGKKKDALHVASSIMLSSLGYTIFEGEVPAPPLVPVFAPLPAAVAAPAAGGVQPPPLAAGQAQLQASAQLGTATLRRGSGNGGQHPSAQSRPVQQPNASAAPGAVPAPAQASGGPSRTAAVDPRRAPAAAPAGPPVNAGGAAGASGPAPPAQKRPSGMVYTSAAASSAPAPAAAPGSFGRPAAESARPQSVAAATQPGAGAGGVVRANQWHRSGEVGNASGSASTAPAASGVFGRASGIPASSGTPFGAASGAFQPPPAAVPAPVPAVAGSGPRAAAPAPQIQRRPSGVTNTAAAAPLGYQPTAPVSRPVPFAQPAPAGAGPFTQHRPSRPPNAVGSEAARPAAAAVGNRRGEHSQPLVSAAPRPGPSAGTAPPVRPPARSSAPAAAAAPEAGNAVAAAGGGDGAEAMQWDALKVKEDELAEMRENLKLMDQKLEAAGSGALRAGPAAAQGGSFHDGSSGGSSARPGQKRSLPSSVSY